MDKSLRRIMLAIYLKFFTNNLLVDALRLNTSNNIRTFKYPCVQFVCVLLQLSGNRELKLTLNAVITLPVCTNYFTFSNVLLFIIVFITLYRRYNIIYIIFLYRYYNCGPSFEWYTNSNYWSP